MNIFVMCAYMFAIVYFIVKNILQSMFVIIYQSISILYQSNSIHVSSV